MPFNTQTETMPVQVGLPFEILLLVMEASPRRTIAKMMRTCHALRDDGARILLSGGVSLGTENSILSFVQFLCVDPDSRFQHLRFLEIASGELHMSAADELLWLITHPSLALDSLTLREAGSFVKSKLSPSELIPDDDPHDTLVTAFAQLKTLRHLTVGQCDALASTLITTICSPLKTISIDFPSDGPRSEDEAESRNPIVLLAKHSATLEEISGSNFAMRPPQALYDTVFPSVWKLSATYDPIWNPLTLVYISAFPNLEHLSLTFAVPSSAVRAFDDGFFPLTRVLRRRDWNKLNLESNAHMSAWKKLEEWEGTVTDVLALGLACHVPMLRLSGTILPKSPEYQHVAVVLEDTRPTGLATTLGGASMFGDTMGSLLRGPSAQQLRALEVEVVFAASEGDVDIQEVLNNVATTLTLLPLHRVALTFNYCLLIAPDETYRRRYGWFCPLERDIENLDLAAAQTLFRTAIPSLTADIAVHLSTDRTSNISMLGVVGDPDYHS
ncbi:hypothetical protein V8D89_001251 [Ganoderma adspersum]